MALLVVCNHRLECTLVHARRVAIDHVCHTHRLTCRDCIPDMLSWCSFNGARPTIPSNDSMRASRTAVRRVVVRRLSAGLEEPTRSIVQSLEQAEQPVRSSVANNTGDSCAIDLLRMANTSVLFVKHSPKHDSADHTTLSLSNIITRVQVQGTIGNSALQHVARNCCATEQHQHDHRCCQRNLCRSVDLLDSATPSLSYSKHAPTQLQITDNQVAHSRSRLDDPLHHVAFDGQSRVDLGRYRHFFVHMYSTANLQQRVRIPPQRQTDTLTLALTLTLTRSLALATCLIANRWRLRSNNNNHCTRCRSYNDHTTAQWQSMALAESAHLTLLCRRPLHQQHSILEASSWHHQQAIQRRNATT
jgi:hypothetical protein